MDLVMRGETDKAKLERFMSGLGAATHGPARVYFTGGGTALLSGWRAMTVDIDLVALPQPSRFFEAIAQLKNELDVNIELASPHDFIPQLPGWQSRSIFIVRHGEIDFYHYDLYSQALAKTERGHARDRTDIDAMLARGLITRELLWRFFLEIEAQLIRYPAIEPAAFRAAVIAVCRPAEGFVKASATPVEIDDLPGAELLQEALHDSGAKVSISSCLLSIAKPRLQRADLTIPFPTGPIPDAELTLYRLLQAEAGDAFSRYQALLRRLVSFERALEHRARQEKVKRAVEKGVVEKAKG